MTREEAIKMLRHCGAEDYCDDGIHGTCKGCNRRIALDMAIEALKREQPDEWCDDCKEYDTEKKCCPRFNKVIREALKREPSEDGTLEVKVEDATKIGRVLISDDKHRGGLYYPDEYEPKGEDLISRTEAIEALGEEPPVWCDEEYEIAERDQWRADIEAIKSVPLADRPRGEQYKKGFEDAKRAFLVEYARESQNMRKRIAQLEVRLNAQKAISADRPKGEWIHTPNGIDRDFVWWTCSECGHKIFSETIKDRIEFHAYCGRCGAEMRLE